MIFLVSKKSGFFARFAAVCLGLLMSLSAVAAPRGKVVVYAYDSFMGKGTLGEVMQKAMRSRGIETEFVVFPDAGEVLSQVELEKLQTRADLVVGVDPSLLPRAQSLGLFAPLGKAQRSRVRDEIQFDPSGTFVPFDFSWLALIYNSEKTAVGTEPVSLNDFARDPRWKKRVVIQDPRTSSVGRGFLLQTVQRFGKVEFDGFWRAFRKQLITISPSWSAAYGMFLKGEAEFVLSYTSSPAYHCEMEKNKAFRALKFSDGQMIQPEGIGMLRSSKNPDAAKQWIETLLSDEIQSQVPQTQWMYPAVATATLPKCFASLPKVDATVRPDPAVAARLSSEWIPRWNALQALSR